MSKLYTDKNDMINEISSYKNKVKEDFKELLEKIGNDYDSNNLDCYKYPFLNDISKEIDDYFEDAFAHSLSLTTVDFKDYVVECKNIIAEKIAETINHNSKIAKKVISSVLTEENLDLICLAFNVIILPDELFFEKNKEQLAVDKTENNYNFALPENIER